MILRDIFFSDKKYYQEFLSSEEGIATNILANRLSVLEENGVISKHQDINNKRKFIYQPTSKGIDLIPVMLEIIAWAVKYDKDTLLPKSKVDYILKHKDKVISETKNKFLTAGLGEDPTS
jgi:DNA-binding HxlR family transcriptional regulator